MNVIMKYAGGLALVVFGSYLIDTGRLTLGDTYMFGCFTGAWLLEYFDRTDRIWSASGSRR